MRWLNAKIVENRDELLVIYTLQTLEFVWTSILGDHFTLEAVEEMYFAPPSSIAKCL